MMLDPRSVEWGWGAPPGQKKGAIISETEISSTVRSCNDGKNSKTGKENKHVIDYQKLTHGRLGQHRLN
jgi:hypothetical protein